MSKRVNAMTEDYELVTVCNKYMLFTPLRIDRDTVPEGMYLYEVRHDDDGLGVPCQIGNWILVNHWGSLISKVPLELIPSDTVNNSYLDIDHYRDWNYEGESYTIDDYIKKEDVIVPDSESTTFEIYLTDLKPEIQKELIEFLGDNGNYDVFPLVTLGKGDD